MRKLSTLVLSLITSSVLLAGQNDHTGNHMHDGKMANHEKEVTTMSGMHHSSHGSKSMSKNAYHNQIHKNGYDITLMSEKPMVSGNNKISVVLQKDGKPVNGAKVRVKFFMPEMPGMPYMEYKAKGKLIKNTYHMEINLGMGGTWQYHLDFKTSDGKTHKTRGSVNI